MKAVYGLLVIISTTASAFVLRQPIQTQWSTKFRLAETTRKNNVVVPSNNNIHPDTVVPSLPDGTLFGAVSPIVWLNGVAILWGSQHSVIKTILEDDHASPTVVLLLRFGLAAALALIPKVLGAMNDDTDDTHRPIDTTTWRWGLELGIFMFLGFLFQAIGLQYTTAQKSGFLLYLNVKFVPFLALILYGRTISKLTWVSALVAFCGTALLATDGLGSSVWNIGDVWTIAAAAASAMFILRIETASQQSSSAADLNAASLVVVTACSVIWLCVSPNDVSTDSIISMAKSHPWELLYLGGVTTAFSNWIQTRAQRYVPAERAALIYSLDPVYGAGFAYLLLGEELTSPAAVLGAALITIAAGTNAYLEFNKKDE